MIDDDSSLIHVLEVVGNAIVGGVEKYVQNLVRSLPGRGFKVTCVTPYESEVTAQLREIGCMVYVTHMEDNPPWRSIQFLSALINHQQIDLIHAHLPKAQVLAGVTACVTHTPFLTTIHGMDITSLELGILRTTGSHLTVVCQAAYAQALSLGIPEEKVTLVPNGVDVGTFNMRGNGRHFREHLGLSPDTRLVGFVGRMNWEKGPDMFIQAAAHIHQYLPDVHFVVVGGGPMREELEDQVRRASLEDNFHLPGVWANMKEVYVALDVLVQTSRVEGMPLTLLEGMASGLPVVAMNVGGVAEIIEVGTTGYLSAVGDWLGLGDAIIRLLEDPELRKAMGVKGRARVEQYFNLNRQVETIASTMRRIVRPGTARGRLEAHRIVSEDKPRKST